MNYQLFEIINNNKPFAVLLVKLLLLLHTRRVLLKVPPNVLPPKVQTPVIYVSPRLASRLVSDYCNFNVMNSL